MRPHAIGGLTVGWGRCAVVDEAIFELADTEAEGGAPARSRRAPPVVAPLWSA